MPSNKHEQLLASLDRIAENHSHLSPELKADLQRHRAELVALAACDDRWAYARKAVQVATWVKFIFDLWNG